MHWNGNPAWFAVPLDANIWDVFGKGCFIVHEGTRQALALDDEGRPTTPLQEGAAYALYCKNSSKLLREASSLKGMAANLRHEVTRTRTRVARMEAVVREQTSAALQILEAVATAAQEGADTAEGLRRAMAELRVMQRRIVEPDGGAEWDDGPRLDADQELAPATNLRPAPRPAPGPKLVTGRVVPETGRPKGGVGRGKPDCPHRWGRLTSGAADGRLVLEPIGEIRSCFAEKNGTPRQGAVCPSSRASLTLKLPDHLNAQHALDGLAGFSHVWLLWHFHSNGNNTVHSKVRPPRLDGERVGVFATRSPHRPNPIGLSAVGLERVEGDTLHLTGVDLIDGTPVFDVKPYVPLADRIEADALRVPPWLRPETAPVHDLVVHVAPTARAQIDALTPSLAFFHTSDEVLDAITQVLRADPRSVYWRQARQECDYGFSIDQLNVLCRFSGGEVTVTHAQHLALCDRAHLVEEARRKGAGAPEGD